MELVLRIFLRMVLPQEFVIAEPKNIGVNSPARTLSKSEWIASNIEQLNIVKQCLDTSSPNNSFIRGSVNAPFRKLTFLDHVFLSFAKSSIVSCSLSYTPLYSPLIPIGQFIGHVRIPRTFRFLPLDRMGCDRNGQFCLQM